ncbi:Transposon Tf2-8 polyprotein [Labeo rohita]|uniref:Gypsy retrotransposon integrase-like protein 1 n=1 Tax=Labeo rohita TaxID=84645 RepID=A0ABQ8M9R2_LABRO|nr:Transposon Tf2-8 polyprotein [Labeo rohita]
MGHRRIVTTAFVDSGAAGNFIDQAYAAQLGIEIEVLSQPLNITAINGRPLNFSPVTHRTKELHLLIDNHAEKIHFFITKITSPPIILGHPWLITHDPFISWTTNRIVHWGATCQELCLQAKAGTCSGESEVPDVKLENIPVPYRDLAEVFSKSRAALLPPHRPYDLAIDLVPGAVPPRCHLYSLSATEHQAMEEYVAEGFRAGTIRPSSSPAAAGFFFVKKKDGGLRPCNLTVIRQTKQLNPRQAQWALFFEHFNFHLSYWPGSKNAKADAISRQHQRDTTTSEPVPVLPPHIILAPLQWGLEERVHQSHSQEPPPPETPTGRLFVPDHLRKEVLQWGHDYTLAGHQGVQRTTSFIGRAFWWRTLRRDVQEYVQACTICAHSKTTNSPSTGELQPLPIPKCPWSYISVDFVTGLPDSQGKNTILTIVDRFSKAAKTTAELILEHVVRLHGFPKDIISDRGPQFTAKFWQAFCRLVGTTASLSSGHHPQTNGQTERANQQLERFLRCFAGEHQRSWARYLVWAELSNNLHTSSATNLSPFEVCYGYQPAVFEHQEPEVHRPAALAHCLAQSQSRCSDLLVDLKSDHTDSD